MQMLSNDTAVVGWAGVRVQVLVRRFVGWSNKNLPFLNVPRTKMVADFHSSLKWLDTELENPTVMLCTTGGWTVSTFSGCWYTCSRINKLIWNRHWAARDRRSLNKLLSITDNPSHPLGYTIQRQQSSYKTVPQLTWLCPVNTPVRTKYATETSVSNIFAAFS